MCQTCTHDWRKEEFWYVSRNTFSSQLQYARTLQKFQLQNFTLIEIIKYDHKIHNTGHKFTFMEIWDIYIYISQFLNTKCKTTTIQPKLLSF
jgi:hypothetical protein